jgi:hypothetical protein
MKRLFATLMSVAVMAAFTPVSEAQTSCPAEVSQAKQLLAKKGSVAKGQDTQAPRSLAGARMDTSSQAPRTSVSGQAPRGQDAQAPRGQDAQAPRGQDAQAPRGQDAQAPRGQDAQAPRGQDAQAPRGQDAQAPRAKVSGQAPRGQDAQAPRGQDSQAPRAAAGNMPSSSKATALIKEAEAACKAGDMTTAKAKAEAAIAELK